MEVIGTIIGLLALVIVLSLVARKIGVPYPTVMVLAGLGICFIPHLPPVRFRPDIVFLVFLPPLLYSAAWETSWRDFRRSLGPILMLAIGFVVFTTCAVAGVMHGVVEGLTWSAAFVLGAIVSPPDAVAATAITGRLGIPGRVATILEGESLLNDASALTLYSLALAAAETGQFTAGQAGLKILLTVGGGVGIGLVLGWIVAGVHRALDEPLAETAITLLAPYAAFLPAEAAGASPVLAVVTMGLYVSHRSPHVFSPHLRLRATAVWEVVTFLLNGLVFVLIGLQLRSIIQGIAGASAIWLAWQVALLIGLLLAARLAWVFPAAYLPRWIARWMGRDTSMPDWRRVFLVAYAGMRGVVSLVVALSIPLTIGPEAHFPRRELILFLTFAVILITLVGQSLTLPAVVRRLGLAGKGQSPCEESQARLEAVRAALRRIDELERRPGIGDNALRRIRDHYTARAQELAKTDPGKGQCPPSGREHRELHRQILDAARGKLLEMYDNETINQEMLDRIQADLDLQDLRLSGDNDADRDGP